MRNHSTTSDLGVTPTIANQKTDQNNNVAAYQSSFTASTYQMTNGTSPQYVIPSSSDKQAGKTPDSIR